MSRPKVDPKITINPGSNKINVKIQHFNFFLGSTNFSKDRSVLQHEFVRVIRGFLIQCEQQHCIFISIAFKTLWHLAEGCYWHQNVPLDMHVSMDRFDWKSSPGCLKEFYFVTSWKDLVILTVLLLNVETVCIWILKYWI